MPEGKLCLTTWRDAGQNSASYGSNRARPSLSAEREACGFPAVSNDWKVLATAMPADDWVRRREGSLTLGRKSFGNTATSRPGRAARLVKKGDRRGRIPCSGVGPRCSQYSVIGVRGSCADSSAPGPSILLQAEGPPRASRSVSFRRTGTSRRVAGAQRRCFLAGRLTRTALVTRSREKRSVDHPEPWAVARRSRSTNRRRCASLGREPETSSGVVAVGS